MPYKIASLGVIIFMILGFVVFAIKYFFLMQKLNNQVLKQDHLFYKQIKSTFSNQINGLSIFFEKDRFLNHKSKIIRDLHSEVLETFKYIVISFLGVIPLSFLLLLNIWRL